MRHGESVSYEADLPVYGGDWWLKETDWKGNWLFKQMNLFVF